MSAVSDNRTLRYPPAEVLSPIPSVLIPPADDPDTMLLNLGPNHPSTHGVLRLVATLNGETVVGLHNELGYVHTGIEKNMEQKSYWKAITYAPRADYNAVVANELVYCMAVEKLLGLEVPRRGEWIRAIFTELQRIHNHQANGNQPHPHPPGHIWEPEGKIDANRGDLGPHGDDMHPAHVIV